MDAQGFENFRTYYPDFEIASNIFEIAREMVLKLGGEYILPFFYIF